ncbi:nucleotide exchange factor GrpE [Mangrovibacterium marinum]|uniref:Protein GrpE n=1 Tax=Mangrovibacterium marinum TaxID=1639118 RepID=A0A2T5C5M1_9BACT|nr:nucleotide exchange factor GrpE [Mangrovibacterium marinum]PTN10216.1 molecular chaperone GrpE [Mangrovibacterium marinum]
MAEEKVVNEQEVSADEVKNNPKEAQTETAKKEHKHDKKSKKDKQDEIQEQIEKLQNQLADMKDKHVRLQAEFDNFRKRTLKEKMELMKSGGEGVLMNIIPVIDDLERALAAFSDVEDENPLKQGVTLIYTKFQEFLKQNGIKEIDAKEKDFDTDLHEAITKIPAPSEELKGKVVDVIQKGYLLHEKVIRFAKVVIGE